MEYPIKFPFELRPTVSYQTNRDIVFVCEDGNTVWNFYWDGASTTFYKLEGWLKYINEERK